VQRERDRTTLGIALLVAAAAVIGKAYPGISIPLIMLAVFFIAWGRDQRRVEAFVGRLPAGSYLLTWLKQLNRIISPRDEQRAKKLLHQCYMEICELFNESVVDIDQYNTRYVETINRQAICIEHELGMTARAKFLDHIGLNSVVFHKARGNTDYNKILRILERTKHNLVDRI
jgi:hypothetical protein